MNWTYILAWQLDLISCCPDAIKMFIPHVVEFKKYVKYLVLISPVLVGPKTREMRSLFNDLISQVFGESCFVFLSNPFMVFLCSIMSTWGSWWTWLMLSQNREFEIYGKGSSHLFGTKAEGKRVPIRWCFARESGAFVGLKTITLNGLFGRALIMHEAVVHVYIMPHSSRGPICTNRLASVYQHNAFWH